MALNFKKYMISLECALLDGKALTEQDIRRLPEPMLENSPLLLQTLGIFNFYKGQLREAKAYFERAIKGFGLMAFPDRLCSAMCWFARVLLRLGEPQHAETLLVFLKQEYERTEAQNRSGELPLALASGAALIACEEHTQTWYMEAVELFEQHSKLDEAADALAELLLYFGTDIDETAWGKMVRSVQRWTEQAADEASANRIRFISDWLAAMRDAHLQRWQQAAKSLETVWQSNDPVNHLQVLHLPYQYVVYSAIVMFRAAIATSSKDIPTYIRQLKELCQIYSDDLLVQHALWSALYEGEQLLGHTSAAHAAYIERQALDRYIKQKKPALPQIGELRLQPTPMTPAPSTRQPDKFMPEPAKWRIRFFGGLQFERGADDINSLHWKRKKAQELCIYLFLQPKYTSPKDQVIETLQLGDDLAKAANALYVIIHQLKQTLRDELAVDNSVFTRGGFVMMREDAFEYVDVERYLTLTRVADQLWHKDRHLAFELYQEAYVLYDDVLPELPYLTWLEQFREYVLGKQIAILRKLCLLAQEKRDTSLEESFYQEWIRLRPYEEEGYQAIIQLLLKHNRMLEAKRIYDNYALLCQKEFGTTPSEETRLLLARRSGVEHV